MQVAGTDLGAALRSAIAGGYVAEMSGQTYTVTAPIVINVTSTIQGPLGIDLGGATIVSQITNGAPVIQINAGPGVDLRYLTLSNFTIQGNGREGDGIKIVADGNDRWIYNFSIDNVMVRGVGGYGLDVQGSVFEGLVSNSRMIGNHLGGAYFGHSAGGGQVSALRWFGGSLEDNGGAGLFLGNGARDISVDGVTIANNNGYGISAEWGITSVTDSQVRDNRVDGIWFQNFGYFNNNTFTTSGVQATGIAGYVVGDAIVTGSRSVYTGSGSDTTVLANLQGPGFAYTTGDTGKIITGPALSVGGPGGDTVADVTVSNLGTSVRFPCVDHLGHDGSGVGQLGNRRTRIGVARGAERRDGRHAVGCELRRDDADRHLPDGGQPGPDRHRPRRGQDPVAGDGRQTGHRDRRRPRCQRKQSHALQLHHPGQRPGR